METTFEKLSATLGNLKVQISQADYQPEVDKKIKEYAKTARVKGFRPGHVPLGYIKKLYGKSLMVDEVIKSVSNTVNSYIADNKIKAVGDPLPTAESLNLDWDNNTDFTFEYEVGMASDFDADLDKIPAIETFEIEPDEEQVSKALEDIQKRYGKDAEIEEAEDGDLVFGEIVQESSAFTSNIGIPTDKLKENSKKLFKGLEKGSSLTIDIQSLFDTTKDLGFAIGKSDEEAASLQGDFVLTVNRISRNEPAELNQELFDQVLGEGKVDNLDDFKKEVKSLIAENYSRETQYLLEYDVEKALFENISIELPDEFLKKWLLQVNEGKFTEEEIEKDYEAFAKGLRLDLIKSEIAGKNDLKVEYPDVLEEVKSEIKNYFGSQGAMQGMDDFIEQMAKKQLSENKNDAFKNYFNKAYGRKVIEFAKSKVAVKKQTVKVDEFNKIASEKYQAA